MNKDERATAQNGKPVAEQRDRGDLAKLIVWGAIALIFVFGVLAIGVAVWLRPPAEETGAVDVATGVLSLLLPVVSAWVGAVLAYYFVNQATEDANRTTLEALQGRTPFADAVRAVPITTAMRTMPQITHVTLEIDTATKRVTTPIARILDVLIEQRRTRAPLFAWDAATKSFVLLYVLHESTVYEYLWRNKDINPETEPIQSLLDDPLTRMRWDMTLAHLPQRAALADAKAAMDSNPRIQDVVITLNGDRGGAFVGWLTNVDVLRHCVAGASALDKR